jgi:hypothetical protein
LSSRTAWQRILFFFETFDVNGVGLWLSFACGLKKIARHATASVIGLAAVDHRAKLTFIEQVRARLRKNNKKIYLSEHFCQQQPNPKQTQLHAG